MELGLHLEECEVLINMENVRKAARGCSVSKSKRDWSVGPSEGKRKYKNAIEFTDTEATYNL